MNKWTKTAQKACTYLLIGTLIGAAPLKKVRAMQSENDSPFALVSEPGISPDGKEIAFVSGGDIWTVPASGGEARLLIAHPAPDSRPLYSPDGSKLAFVSGRTGNGDIYVFSLSDGKLRRLTYDEGTEELSGWSADGKYLLFHSNTGDIASMYDIWKIPVAGGTPMPVSADRYATEYYGTASPDNQHIAFAARGMAGAQWWRRGSSHLDHAEIWIRPFNAAKMTDTGYRRITPDGARSVWPMWDSNGKSLFFVSDRSGNQNLWKTDLEGKSMMLTRFTDSRVLWPSITKDASTIVFERDWKIWRYDVASQKANALEIRLRGNANHQLPQYKDLSNEFQELAVSPDGKKLVFSAHGDLFASSATAEGEAVRLTNTPEIEGNAVWASDSKSVFFSTHSTEHPKLFRCEVPTQTVTALPLREGDYSSLVLSPDGSHLAYIRNTKELAVFDLEAKKEQILYQGSLGRMSFASNISIAWSPDGQYLAFANYDSNAIRNIWVVASKGGDARPISFLSNTFGSSVDWSADGKYIYFTTSQRTENARIARVELFPHIKPFKEDRFYQLFKEKPSSAKKDSMVSTRVDFKDIKGRLSFLPFDASVNNYAVSKDGKTLLFTVTNLGQQSLYSYSLDELATDPNPKLIYNSRGRMGDIQFSNDDKQVYFLQGGKVFIMALANPTPKPLAITAHMDIDFNQEKNIMLYQAWEVLNKGFYDPKFHGVDWTAMLTRYRRLAAASSTPEELRRVLNLMVGELNASHMGASGSSTEAPAPIGRLGLQFDAATYEQNGRFVISEVLTDGPAANSGKIQTGDQLVAVDGKPLTKSDNLQALLSNKTGKKVTLKILSAGGKEDEVALSPINMTVEKRLRYRQWVEQQRSYVDKISHGRLGYVHMLDMSEASLHQLYLDLDAQTLSREGVVIDIRNNNGGFVNAYALDVFSRKPYLTMTGRDMPASPARIQLGQRALQKPTILVTNQHSLSDAEDFTEGYRTMKLGKVVGEPTAGWIIFTSAARLIDGSSIRLPFSRITDHEGKDMELHPRPVDVPASRPIGESYGSKNIQLDTAVNELLKELNPSSTTR
ncbi:DPP IV N-terminal domain-containing protein [Olivibacter sp. XZL3]|uniref:S41 family peptidase n=1 Tax=Olivibacter sp. XZL3 TaxID=1735116 RepID=UPI001F0D7330|nr:DPP IV N-terminal domain-containing protein [Olivibacter sp. XZL3]